MSTHSDAITSEAGDGYRGIATVEFDDLAIEAEVILHGHIEPIDGVYRWYGRIAKDSRLSQHLEGRKAPATVHTPTGSAPAAVGEPDLWDRYRIIGRHHPPYRLTDTV